MADVAVDGADEKGVAWLVIAEDSADGEELCMVALVGASAMGLDKGDVRGIDARGRDGVGERATLEGTLWVEGARDAAGSYAVDDAMFAVSFRMARPAASARQSGSRTPASLYDIVETRDMTCTPCSPTACGASNYLIVGSSSGRRSRA